MRNWDCCIPRLPRKALGQAPEGCCQEFLIKPVFVVLVQPCFMPALGMVWKGQKEPFGAGTQQGTTTA